MRFFCYGNLENSVDQVVLQSAVPVVTAVIQEHLQNGAVLKTACSVLWALSLQGVFSQGIFIVPSAWKRPNTSVGWFLKYRLLGLRRLCRWQQSQKLRLINPLVLASVAVTKLFWKNHGNYVTRCC